MSTQILECSVKRYNEEKVNVTVKLIEQSKVIFKDFNLTFFKMSMLAHLTIV